METLTFSISTVAPLPSLYWASKHAPDKGAYIEFEEQDDGGLTGSVEGVEAGDFVYILVLEGGQPQSEWELSIQREGKKPLKRKGTLDGNGEGGRVGEITLV